MLFTAEEIATLFLRCARCDRPIGNEHGGLTSACKPAYCSIRCRELTERGIFTETH